MYNLVVICEPLKFNQKFEKLLIEAFPSSHIERLKNCQQANDYFKNPVIPIDLLLFLIDDKDSESFDFCAQLLKHRQLNFVVLVMSENETVSNEQKLIWLDAGVDAITGMLPNWHDLQLLVKEIMRKKRHNSIASKKVNPISSNKALDFIEDINSKIYYSQLFEMAPIGMGIIKEDKFVHFNPYFSDFIQFSNDCADDFFPQIQSVFPAFESKKEFIYAQLNMQKSYLFETRMLSLGGIVHDVELKLSYFEEDDTKSSILFTLLDVSERKRNDSLRDFFYNLNQSVNSSTSIGELLRLLQKNLNTLIDASNFYVALYNIIDDTLSLPYFMDEYDKFECIPLDKTLAALVVSSKKCKLLKRDDIQLLLEKGEIELYGKMAEVWLGVPLIIGNKLIGMMAVQSYLSGDAYTQQDVDLLEFIATQIAVLIERKDNEIKLQTALKKADASDKLKTAFLSNMSHEVRTPMNSILGFSSLLYSDDITEEEKKLYLDLVTENGYNLLQIIDDIVDVSKLEAGELTLLKADVNILRLMHDIEISTQKLLAKLNKENLLFTLNFPLNIDELILKTDPFRLKQVLNNLISNAIKFTNSGEIKVGFEIGKDDLLEFYVADTGIGIKQEDIDKIFDQFRQLDDNDTRIAGGNGLGLTIAKKIVQLLGGNLRVESEPEKGSIFRFSILAEKAKFVSNTNEKLIVAYNWASKTILIAEDVLPNYQYLETLLEKTKCKILWAKNGKEAVEMVDKNWKIDLILMDIQMPVLNGLQASRMIKERMPQIPIIAQTAFDMMTSKDEILRAGCNDYIAKPIKSAELLAMIDRWI